MENELIDPLQAERVREMHDQETEDPFLRSGKPAMKPGEAQLVTIEDCCAFVQFKSRYLGRTRKNGIDYFRWANGVICGGAFQAVPITLND